MPIKKIITNPQPTSSTTLSKKEKKKLRKKVYMAHEMWHMTHNMWQVTCDMWHITWDMWHLIHGGGWTFSQNVCILAFTGLEGRWFEDL